MSLASLNPNAEVEREARLALNFGVRAKFPQGLSEEVEACPHVRDLRLLGRVDLTGLIQEALKRAWQQLLQPIEREIRELSARGLRLAVLRLPSRTKSDPRRISLVPCNWTPPTTPLTTA
ncbi:MAG: hypothetical protein NTX09_06830 [Verrucomicrobia bacterium]|nr:hypothetical protein [Verrucomicrobiota bacterium]